MQQSRFLIFAILMLTACQSVQQANDEHNNYDSLNSLHGSLNNCAKNSTSGYIQEFNSLEDKNPKSKISSTSKPIVINIVREYDLCINAAKHAYTSNFSGSGNYSTYEMKLDNPNPASFLLSGEIFYQSLLRDTFNQYLQGKITTSAVEKRLVLAQLIANRAVSVWNYNITYSQLRSDYNNALSDAYLSAEYARSYDPETESMKQQIRELQEKAKLLELDNYSNKREYEHLRSKINQY